MADILIMEDDDDQARLLSAALVDRGHKVDVRSSGTAALNALSDTPYDLLITDIFVINYGRPVPDGGMLLIGRLRNRRWNDGRPWLDDLPIIAITGAQRRIGQETILTSAEAIGADLTLAKPIALDDLYHAVDLALERRHQVHPRRVTPPPEGAATR